MRDLADYTTGGFDRGASRGREVLWVLCKGLFFLPPWPWPSRLRAALLRAFGARVGRGVVIRSGANILFPWRLVLGDHVWIGEEAWLLNLAEVRVESHVCLSQRAFLCAGSHDHRKASFDLIVRPIVLREGCWVAAGATVCAGVEIGRGAVLSAGSVALADIPAGRVARGNPAVVVGETRGGERV